MLLFEYILHENNNYTGFITMVQIILYTFILICRLMSVILDLQSTSHVFFLNYKLLYYCSIYC